jgi:hypothetical protein
VEFTSATFPPAAAPVRLAHTIAYSQTAANHVWKEKGRFGVEAEDLFETCVFVAKTKAVFSRA